MNSKPQLLAWMTCDAVHIDPSSGKHTILGVFSNIRARQFPVVHPMMVWFLTLTDVGQGAHQLRISMGTSPTTLVKVIERDFQAENPLQRINLINEIRNCRFEAAGEYELLIEVDDEPLLATSMHLTA